MKQTKRTFFVLLLCGALLLGAVGGGKAEIPNMDFIECAGELGTLFSLNSSFGEESRQDLLDDLKMPMEMYMKLEDLEAVYELYWHQHQYSQNAELDMSRRGIISLSEQEIINKYLEEYQTKYVEYNYKIKEVLGKRYNDLLIGLLIGKADLPVGKIIIRITMSFP